MIGIDRKRVRELKAKQKPWPKAVSEWLDSVEPCIEPMERLDVAQAEALPAEESEKLKRVALLAIGQVENYRSLMTLRASTRPRLSPKMLATAARLNRVAIAASRFLCLAVKEADLSAEPHVPEMDIRGGETGSARRRFRKAARRYRQSVGTNAGKLLILMKQGGAQINDCSGTGDGGAWGRY